MLASTARIASSLTCSTSIPPATKWSSSVEQKPKASADILPLSRASTSERNSLANLSDWGRSWQISIQTSLLPWAIPRHGHCWVELQLVNIAELQKFLRILPPDTRFSLHITQPPCAANGNYDQQLSWI